jgi:hypothetical protein
MGCFPSHETTPDEMSKQKNKRTCFRCHREAAKDNLLCKRCFKTPLLKQCNILANLQSVPLSGEEGRAWNATICRIFKAFIEKAVSARTNNEKKLTYEYLAIFLIGAIEGFTVIGHDERGPAEEVDLWVANESTSNFWQRIGNPFIVECKNWGEPVGVQRNS